MNIELSVNDSLAQALSHKRKALEKAMQRAVRKTHQWLLRQVARAIAQETLIPQKGIKPRVFSDFDAKALRGHVWVGLNPLDAKHSGSLSQAKFGARAGKHLFNGAFVARLGSAPQNIYKRKGAGRFPLIKQTIDIEEPGFEVMRRLEKQAKHYFEQRLDEEINYALNVE